MTLKADELESLLEYLRSRRGFDFTGYKRSTLSRRIEKRMKDVGVATCEEYIDHLEVEPEEFARLFDTILINVTAFFRDPEYWQAFREQAVAGILGAREPDSPLRIWIPGCASGEEVFTTAIVLAEEMGVEQFRERVKIYASDLDESALSQARQAIYSTDVLDTVPLELREKYFEPSGSRYVFRPDLRRPIVFGGLDLVQDAPISRVDLIVCRNTLMYFHTEMQGRILARFHSALNDDGYLFLGKAEMLLRHGTLFEPEDMKHRIFRKVPRGNPQDPLHAPSPTPAPQAMTQGNEPVDLRDGVLEAVPYAQIAVDSSDRMALANRPAMRMFELLRSDLGRPFSEMDLSYRPADLRPVIDEVRASGQRKVLSDVRWDATDGRDLFLEIIVSPVLAAGGGWLGATISFIEITEIHRLREELHRSNQELETAYEELQSVNEELETTNVELQSTVGELDSTNEELQASNEELQTMNEELQTVNDEMRVGSESLVESNAFLQSLLSSLRISVIVVDPDLRVTGWDERSVDLWGVRPDEALGEHLAEIDFGLPVEEVRDEVGACARGDCDEVVRTLEAVNRRGKPFRLRLRIVPFLENGARRQGALLLIEEVE